MHDEKIGKFSEFKMIERLETGDSGEEMVMVSIIRE